MELYWINAILILHHFIIAQDSLICTINMRKFLGHFSLTYESIMRGTTETENG